MLTLSRNVEVKTNFGFNFGRIAKQPSLPSRPRRTPTPQRTPRAVPSSGKQPRSGSTNSSVRQFRTPKALQTPQLGKRKRGSHNVQTREEDDVDELSPENDPVPSSIERQHREAASTVSPIREEADEDLEPDELSFEMEGTRNKRLSVTPMAAEITNMSMSARRTSVRRPRSTGTPVTPSLRPSSRLRISSAASNHRATPQIAQDQESEDELSTPQVKTPGHAAATVANGTSLQPLDELEEEDELASPAQSVVRNAVVLEEEPARLPSPQEEAPPAAASLPAKRSRPKRQAIDQEVSEEQDVAQGTLQIHQSRSKKRRVAAQDPDDPGSADELSPEVNRTENRRAQPRETSMESLTDEESDHHKPRERSRTPIVSTVKPKKVERASNRPPQQRKRVSGPRRAFTVMRFEDDGKRGLTGADVMRTHVEEVIDEEANRLRERAQDEGISGSEMRRNSRKANLVLQFKDSLMTRWKELQGYNDLVESISRGSKLLRNENVQRRKAILEMQNDRQRMALEMDRQHFGFDSEKKERKAKSKLNADIMAIQAAVQNGRAYARREGRAEEGPDIPLSMLVETVGRRVGSSGGGLLAAVQGCNRRIERVAEWLERRPK